MKKQILFIMFLILSLALFAQGVSDEASKVEDTPLEGLEPTSAIEELFSRWQVLTLALILLSITIVAIIYSLAHAFDMPDLKAWAKIEIVQAIVSALLLAGFIAFLLFFDGLFMGLISSTGYYSCDPGDVKGCSAQIASEYINGLVKLGREQSASNIQGAYLAAKEMGDRHGWTGHTLIIPPLFWLSYSQGTNGWQILNLERLSQVTEYYGPILSSLYAQQFFVEHLSYNVGPYLLVLGLLTRTFFATRKLGGLLIAIAIGVMFVFPLMYVFNALTLSVAAFGDNPSSLKTGGMCPEACTTPIPLGYFVDDNHGVYSSDARNSTKLKLDENIHNPEEYQLVYDVLLAGKTATLEQNYEGHGKEIASCGWPDPNNPAYPLCDPSGEGCDKGCPPQCRGIPYPALSESCQDVEVKANCNALPPVCKRNLVMNTATFEGVYKEQWELCPDNCKTIAPLKDVLGECGEGEVKFYLGNVWSDYGAISDLGNMGLSGRHNIVIDACDKKFQDFFNTTDEFVPAPDFPIEGQDYHWNKASWYDWYEAIDSVTCRYVHVDGACSVADSECKVNYYGIDESGNKIFIREFPDYCSQEQIKLAEACPMPPGLEDGDIITDDELAAYESCLFIAPIDTEDCVKCMFVDDPFTYTVPVIVDCSALCGDEMILPPKISSSDFATMSSEGMYGKEDIKSVAGFMLPAYVLPLFNVLVTIMFIKTFSPILGGDIEIPGISQVF